MSKVNVLAYVEEQGEATSADLAKAFAWTLPGAASTLLRLHRQGHLRRDRRPGATTNKSRRIGSSSRAYKFTHLRMTVLREIY
jgi:DNA-binding MarR family transcriptional regulator